VEVVKKHRFTVEEYHKMGEAGIFSEDDRVELIGGEVVEIAAMGDRQVESVMRLNRLLSRWALLEEPGGTEGASFFVSPRSSLGLAVSGEPQPDIELLRRDAGRSGTPVPEEVLLVAEVADTSLQYDRETKLPLYDAAGIPEVWIMDLTDDSLEVYSDPASGGYGTVSRARRGERVVSPTVPNLTFGVAEALPPEA